MLHTEWQYDVKQYQVKSMLQLVTDHYTDAFNALGREGWELCGFTTSPQVMRTSQRNPKYSLRAFGRRPTPATQPTPLRGD